MKGNEADVADAGRADADALNRLIVGFQVSRMLRVVADLGVADRVPQDAGKPVAALAAECGVVPDALLRLCRALAAFGVFSVAGDKISHSRLSALLRTDADGSLHVPARFWTAPGNWGAWAKLDRALLTAEAPHQAAWGMSRFDYMQAHPDEAKVYDARMAGASWNRQQAIAEAYDFSGASLLIDVGGGNGALLRAILTRYPEARGVVFDRDHVVSAIPADLRLDGRLQLAGGDFLAAVPAGGDVYLLSWILHDWPDDICRTILQNCRAAMHPRARLLIADRVLEPDPSRGDPMDYLADMQMMVLGGRERTVPEFQDLLNAAGFGPATVTPTASPVSLLTAAPA